MSWAALPTILGDAFLEENRAILAGVVKAGTSRNTEDGIRRMLDAMLAFPALDALAGYTYTLRRRDELFELASPASL